MARRCSICKEKHESKGIANVCESFECRVAFAEIAAAKSKAKREQQVKKAQTEQRKRDKKQVLDAKPIKYWEDRAQAAVNEYVRLRDANCECISCGKPASWTGGDWHASHLKSRGANSFLRFHLWNIHKSCSVCNYFLSGNVAEYERRLVAKIGAERVEFLNNAPRLRKYSVEYLQRLESVFKRKSKMLRKRMCI